jgi:ubiquinone/menaquinone biosynthesis C-methylase UbiE
MASTNLTFDVAIWFAPADTSLARTCARHLARHQLRVTLIPCNSPSNGPHAIDPKFEPLARANATVIGRRGVSAWLEAQPAPAPCFDPDLLTLVGPGLAAGEGRRLQKYLPGRVWDLRAAWEDEIVWSAVSRSLLEVGYAHETQVEARSSLMPSNLQHMTVCSYDAIAKQFSEYWSDHPPQYELEQFLQRLAPGSRVLDAGCGPGHHAKILADAGHDVVAVDLSDGMLAQARQRVRSVRLLKMDIRKLRLGSGAFDAIWCAAAVHHVPREQLLAVLKGFRRVLKQGGLLGLNFQVGRRSEIVERQLDRRFFEYYSHAGEIAGLLSVADFLVEGQLYGRSRCNTHGLDMMLKWSTLYARSGLRSDLFDPFVSGQDRSTQIDLSLAPRNEVNVFDP